MHFRFVGNLCSYFCDDCREPLADVQVRLYRPQGDVAAVAAAAAKQTFAVLGEAAVAEKAERLLAEARTDAQGNFTVELDEEKGDYQGGALEVDVRVERVPGQPEGERGDAEPVQFTVTTVQPRWREREDVLVAIWEHCLSAKYWCAILSLFDVWVICGRVVVAASGAPVPNVVVRAFDNDWIEDDPLGQDTTDSGGHFRITYTSATFKQTFLSPIVNVETPLFAPTVGPDVYFHVDTATNVPLLHEDPSIGYTSARENVSNCFCVTLELEEGPVTEHEDPPPVFNRIGGYNFLTQIDSGPGGDGKTLGSDRAFYSNLRLNGVLPKHLNGQPAEYMFEVAQWTGATPPPSSAYTQVPLTDVAKTNIGDLLTVTSDPTNPVHSEPYYVNGSAGEKVVSVTADGWIQVPQESNPYGAGYFQPNGNMIRLISAHLTSESLDMSGLVAGNSATSTGEPLAHNDYFAIRMWIREAGNPASKQLAGTCQRLAICNARYQNVPQGGSWAPSTVSNVLAVHTIDVEELKVGGGCTQITNSLTVKYTAAAANLGNVHLKMDGPGGPYSFAPIASSPDTFGTASPSFTVATLPKCAYLLTLSVQVLLTTGDHNPDNLHDQIAFCK